jgi:hypothetical protein
VQLNSVDPSGIFDSLAWVQEFERKGAQLHSKQIKNVETCQKIYTSLIYDINEELDSSVELYSGILSECGVKSQNDVVNYLNGTLICSAYLYLEYWNSLALPIQSKMKRSVANYSYFTERSNSMINMISAEMRNIIQDVAILKVFFGT